MPTPRVGAVLSLAGACLLLTGCFFNKEGGDGWSFDKFTYVSTSWQPKTVSLVDTRTGETLWSVDIPVGEQLVVRFRKGSGPNEYKPDMMDWGLAEAGTRGSITKNRMPVPARAARRIDMTLRAAPEMPGAPLPEEPVASVDTYIPIPRGGEVETATAREGEHYVPSFTTSGEQERTWPIYTTKVPPEDGDN